MIGTILLDLDGVVRHFDPLHVAQVEGRHGLPPGSLRDAAFTPEILEPVITGQISRQKWVENVGNIVGSPAAAAEWTAHRGRVDAEMLALVHRLRAAGLTVAVLTNGTDTIPAEMAELGVDAHFDVIFNSAEIGFAKPDIRAFAAVCASLTVDPSTIFFTDDSPSKLAGAIELGMSARPFKSLIKFQADLADVGVTY